MWRAPRPRRPTWAPPQTAARQRRVPVDDRRVVEGRHRPPQPSAHVARRHHRVQEDVHALGGAALRKGPRSEAPCVPRAVHPATRTAPEGAAAPSARLGHGRCQPTPSGRRTTCSRHSRIPVTPPHQRSSAGPIGARAAPSMVDVQSAIRGARQVTSERAWLGAPATDACERPHVVLGEPRPADVFSAMRDERIVQDLTTLAHTCHRKHRHTRGPREEAQEKN